MTDNKRKPTVTELISLDYPLEAKASPDGSKVAFNVRTTDWNKNQYQNILHIYDQNTEKTYQLTRNGSVEDFEWLGKNIITLCKIEEKPQLYLYENLVGDPVQITWIETGVNNFKTTKNGVIFQSDHPEKSKRKQTRDNYGNVTHFEEENPITALYYTNPNQVKQYQIQKKQLTEDQAKELIEPILEITSLLPKPLQVVGFHPVSDGVYLVCKPKDYLVYWNQFTNHKITLDLDKALENHIKGDECSGETTQYNLPGVSYIVGVSPDEQSLLIEHKERDDRYYTQADLWTHSLEHVPEEPLLPHLKKITGKIDQRCNYINWTKEGVYVGYAKGTVTGVSLIEPDGVVNDIDFKDVYPELTLNVNKNGYMAYVGCNAESFPDVYVSETPVISKLYSVKITSYHKQVEDCDLGKIETIQWKSRDGATIEGVLRKPSNYDSSKKYPLLFQVHGGPASFSREWLLEPYDYQRYPCVQMVNQDVIVLKPNYRGSIGYGQAFLELNKNNLGVGDLWDLETAIEQLVEQEIVDPDLVGTMGWSQGGYISAFAGLHSTMFKAVSVGAGISDWYTYHISNDIPQFTDHYLSANPWEDPEIYRKTAPISAIDRAHTPMLIQHGGKDQRVPLSNGMELYRALKAKGVPVELFIYPDMGHPITKPKENRAVMQQNLDWFTHYLVDSGHKSVNV